MNARILVVAVLLLVRPISQAQQPTSSQNPAPPLSVANIEHGLKAGVTNTRMAKLVKQYGVDFELTDAIEKWLRAAGASDELLRKISGSSHSSASSSTSPPQQPPSSDASVVLVDTDETCHLVLDDQDEGTITPSQSRKLRTPPGEHIVKCSVENAPDLLWRKVVEIRAGSQSAVAISLKDLHNQKKQAVAAEQQQQRDLTGTADATQNTQEPQADAAKDLAAGRLSEETINAFMHEWFGYDSSLTWKITSIKPSEIEGWSDVNVVISGNQGQQALKLYITRDGKHAITGDIMPFGAHPFADAEKTLEKGVTGPSHGPANGPVTVVEFSDLQCPHCKDAQPTLDKLMSKDKNVRIIFQSFPLPMHDWAAKAAAYADCVSRNSNDAFWKFVPSVYAAQGNITAANADEKLTGLAVGAGVKGADVAACATKPETISRVEKSVALGKELNVDSAPIFFINGRKIPAVPYEVLEKLVNFAAQENVQAKK